MVEMSKDSCELKVSHMLRWRSYKAQEGFGVGFRGTIRYNLSVAEARSLKKRDISQEKQGLQIKERNKSCEG